MQTQNNNIQLSIVSPVYLAEKIIPELVKRINESVSKITSNYEIILVEDCGPDKSWQEIQKQAAMYPQVRGLKLSRNFGQHYAITAGIQQAKGKWIVVMDCDLQDQPEEIIKLYNEAQKGFDIVLAKRISRQDNFIKKMVSKLFYKFLGYMTETDQDSTIANFGIYHQKVIAAVITMKEQIKFFPAAIKWVGFNRTEIAIEHAQRFEGKSAYDFSKLIRLGFNTVIAFSETPLKLVVKLGILISGISFILAIVLVLKALNNQFSVLGWPSLIISICFFSGLIIFILGIIGLYLSRVFNEVKGRPLFIIDQKTY